MSQEISSLLAAALAALGAPSAGAALYYVEPVVTVGEVSPDETAAVGELMRNSVQSHGHQIVSAPGPGVYVLRPKLVRQGELYTITIESVLDSRVVYAAKAGPLSMAEVQAQVDLLVHSAISGRPVEKEVQVGEVRPQDVAPGPRKKPFKQWMLGFGPIFMNDSFQDADDDESDPKPNVALSRIWQIDEDTALRLFVESTFIDGSDRLVGGGLAAAYFFSRKETSPFVSADLGYGAALRDEHEDRHGFLFGGLAGFQFFRTSEVNLEVAFRLFSLARSVGGGSPVGYGLRVGLNF